MTRILAWASKRPALVAVLVILLTLLACRPAGDPVRATLDAVAAAARERSADRLMDRIAADFHAADGSSRADVEATVRRYFAAYEMLDVELSGVTIERSGSGSAPASAPAGEAALARFTAKLSGQAKKLGGLDAILPPSSTWRFEARLVPEGGTWKIAWASWQQIS